MQPRLENALMINGTDIAEDLIDQIERFKDSLVEKMRLQLAEALAQAKLAGITSQEELSKIVQEVQQKWDHLIRVEVKRWSETELKAWVKRAESAWVGDEGPVVDKIRTFLDKLDKHAPSRGGSYVPLIECKSARLNTCL